MVKINNTPVRTSRNFKINNIEIDEKILPNKVSKFDNIFITNESKNIKIDSNIKDINLTYGLGDILINEVKYNANQKLRIVVDSKSNENVNISFKFDENNIELVDNIQIVLNENTKANLTIEYTSNKDIRTYHNGIINLIAKNGANANITVVNLLNKNSYNFLSIENTLNENSKINYYLIDLGGKTTITNYYSNIKENFAQNNLQTIYLGTKKDLIDLNYIAELKGKKSKINIEVEGALKDTAKKNFKGTIDFKKGCKKAIGNEEEACMLLSDTAKALALPMLLCSEEDVAGSHATSAGKIDNKELFYIMSRGFSLKEAQKLIVRAKFNKVLENIKDEELKQKIINEINSRLD